MPTRFLIPLAAILCTLIAFTPAVEAAPRCTLGAQAGDLTVAVAVPGQTDRPPVLVHVPAGGGRGLPLVLDLHGSGSWGSEQMQRSGLAATADAHHFVVAAPDAGIKAGKGYVWNIPGVPTITGKVPAAGDNDDVAYLSAVIATLGRRMCIDTSRVYATGLSGGGRMTSWLGCALADKIAAIAPVVGLRAGNPDPHDPTRPDPTTCNPSRAMPVMAFAGGADTTNPVAGGGGGYWKYSMAAALARWAALDGCTQKLPRRWLAAGRFVDEYGGCRDGVTVAAVTQEDGVHSWANADDTAMWRFFSHYRLPR